jgi:hypothetical protein
MNLSSKININEGHTVLCFSASIILHALIFFTTAFLLNLSFDKSIISSSYVQITTNEITGKTLIDEGKNQEKITEQQEEKKIAFEKEENKSSSYINFNNIKADTSNLEQVYSESTLNVSIKYPVGWTYIDQNVKNKLDGVTFWSQTGNYSPPPYIHLEVKEKYLFNSQKYKYSFVGKNYIAYYNDPEELAGQVSQTIYIRTDEDEDYSIKLIMEGEKSFKTFQPVFFGMIKSFKFGESFF